MYCQKCGTQNPDGQAFCTNCGEPLFSAVQSTEPYQPAPSSAPIAAQIQQSELSDIPDKPKKKKKGCLIAVIIAALVFFAFVVIVALFAPDSEESEATAPAAATETVPQRAEAIGKSDLSADDLLSGMKPHSMLNDTTGHWKLVTLATTTGDVERYALDYYLKYFSKEASDEVHWLVNFTNKTTTSIKCLSGILFVDVFEYVDGEEHDAKSIGGGLPMASYLIYLDNGDIEKV